MHESVVAGAHQASIPVALHGLCKFSRGLKDHFLLWPNDGAPNPPCSMLFAFCAIALSALAALLQYTFILHASKEMPKQVTNFTSGRSKQRTTVGVRVPDCTVCQVCKRRGVTRRSIHPCLGHEMCLSLSWLVGTGGCETAAVW